MGSGTSELRYAILYIKITALPELLKATGTKAEFHHLKNM
jgi:hypothetical protein